MNYFDLNVFLPSREISCIFNNAFLNVSTLHKRKRKTHTQNRNFNGFSFKFQEFSIYCVWLNEFITRNVKTVVSYFVLKACLVPCKNEKSNNGVIFFKTYDICNSQALMKCIKSAI